MFCVNGAVHNVEAILHRGTKGQLRLLTMVVSSVLARRNDINIQIIFVFPLEMTCLNIL